jgi:hypothetical protein
LQAIKHPDQSMHKPQVIQHTRSLGHHSII